MGVHTEAELLAKMEADKELEPPAPDPNKPGGRRPGGQRPGNQHPDQEPKPREQPKPDDQTPKEPNDKRQPDPEPKLPKNPSQEVEEAIQTPVPEELKKQFEERTGYANFYFNRENTERVWRQLQAHGDFSAATGPWTIEGQQLNSASGPASIAIHLTDERCDIELPTGDTNMTVSKGLDSQLNPPGSGGLLSALYLWRKLLIGGPGKYGQVTYGGTAPVIGHPEVCDVLVAVGNGVETLFYCDPADGTLVALEMYSDDDADPCEVYFSQYEPDHGRLVPHRMEVRYGMKTFGTFSLTDFNFEHPPEKTP